jgi:RNA polymerase sigma factor (TIGR02999 family)
VSRFRSKPRYISYSTEPQSSTIFGDGDLSRQLLLTERAQSAVTELLAQARDGDKSALQRLFPLVYEELRGIARLQRRRQAPHDTMNTTAIVHEAYIKLVGNQAQEFKDRAHFLAVAATAMRQVLIDYARRQAAGKRGGGAATISFDEIEAALDSGAGFTDSKALALLALDDALARLQQRSERQSRVVECRFWGGMSIEETAEALAISPATVKRDWADAQAWLYRELREGLA